MARGVNRDRRQHSRWHLLLLLAFASALAGGEPPAPRTAGEWASVASQRLKDGNREGALDALQAAVAADPSHGAAGMLITTLHQAGRVEEAYALGERYLREGPRNPRALFRHGWLLAFLGEIDRAEALFRQLVELDKGGIYEAWGNGELAYLARARGDARAAVGYMERAVAARPGDAISRVGRAMMLVEAGEPRAAVPLLEAELAADPKARGYGSMPAALVLGWAQRQLGDEAAAARWLAPLESELFAAQPGDGVRQLGMEPMHAARQLAYLAVSGRHEEALRLADAVPTIPLYGAPEPNDGMLEPLVGEPGYEALLNRSREHVDAERARLGLPKMKR
jgi:Flp pilus assembly protein TadD